MRQLLVGALLVTALAAQWAADCSAAGRHLMDLPDDALLARDDTVVTVPNATAVVGSWYAIVVPLPGCTDTAPVSAPGGRPAFMMAAGLAAGGTALGLWLCGPQELARFDVQGAWGAQYGWAVPAANDTLLCAFRFCGVGGAPVVSITAFSLVVAPPP